MSTNNDPATRRVETWLALVARLVPSAMREDWRRQWLGDLHHHLSLHRRHGLRRPLALVRHAVGALFDAAWIHLDRLREGVLFDLRLALRSAARRPTATSMMVLVLALGLGGSVLVGSAVDSVLLAPLPYPEPERLVRVWETHGEAGLEHVPTASGNLVDFRAANGFESLAGYYETPRTIRPGDRAEVVEIAQVSAGFFDALGTPPALGRTFTDEETERSIFDTTNTPRGEDPLIVLSYAFWQSRFGGDFSIVGQDVELEGRRWEIVGVMPASFSYPSPEIEAWIPWSFAGERPRDQRYLRAVGRLAPGVDLARAEDSLRAVAADLARRFPDTNEGWSVEVEPLHEAMVGGVRERLWVAFGAIACVWLLATVNVAVLRLVQARARRGEVTIRRALGASRLRLGRLVLIESAVPVVVGGVLGLGAAGLTLAWARRTDVLDLPRLAEWSLRPRLFAFALLVALLTTFLVSLGPVFLGSQRPADARGRTSDRASRRWRSSLVAAEVALAMVLLTGAGLFAHSLWKLYRVDPGFDARGVLVAPVILDRLAYDAQGSREYYRRARERLAALPGVVSVGAATVMPMSTIGPDFDRPVWADGEKPTRANDSLGLADMRMATPGLFETLRIPLLRGRDFSSVDRPGSPAVTIVNQALADRLWPAADPIGQRLVVDLGGEEPTYEVVGVVADVRRRGLREPPRPEFYVPHAQRPYLIMNLAIRVDGRAAPYAPTIESAILELDRSRPAHSVLPLADLVDGSVRAERATALLVTILGAVALLLAAVGVYGALAMWVEQSRRELGIRMALGAARGQISRHVLGLAAGLLGAGLLVGAVLASAAGHWVRGLLYGVEPVDPAAFTLALVVLGLAGSLATWRPLARALSTDPARCLRHE